MHAYIHTVCAFTLCLMVGVDALIVICFGGLKNCGVDCWFLLFEVSFFQIPYCFELVWKLESNSLAFSGIQFLQMFRRCRCALHRFIYVVTL